MGRPKKTDPPKHKKLDTYTNGEDVITQINDFAKLHGCTPKEIYIETENEYGYYDEVDVAVMMYYNPKKDK